jgi:hypothetical protein
MLSRQRLEEYRRMTPNERLALSLQAMRESWPYLFYGSDDVVDRKFEAIRRENDLRNSEILRVLYPDRNR